MSGWPRERGRRQRDRERCELARNKPSSDRPRSRPRRQVTPRASRSQAAVRSATPIVRGPPIARALRSSSGNPGARYHPTKKLPAHSRNIAHPGLPISERTTLTPALINNIAEIKTQQMDLDLTRRTWGGTRKGAGRPRNDRGEPSHASRDPHVARYPVHVTMRTVPEIRDLRRAEVYDGVRAALDKIAERTAFRVVHFSLQNNHIHLIAEADDPEAFDCGMRALTISLARRINKALGRRGRVFAYRFHSTPLRSPRQTRHAISYVLNNWRRHNEDERGTVEDRFAILDRYSSAISFTGWSNWSLTAWPRDYQALRVTRPRTWLLGVGWQRGGKPIRTDEVPGPLPASKR